jgi:HAD superfamily hydrolase (TIGR01450 family)
LRFSELPLVDVYDGLLIDLDGVIQLDDQPVAGAPQALDRLRRRAVRIAFVTNNAARSPADVAARLHHLGVPADVEQIVTSAMAAANLLAGDLAPGSRVLVVGGTGLVAAISRAGLTPVSSADDGPVAVVQGWGPDVGWAELAEAAVALRSGARWVVTNRDRTLPSPRGPLPGSGALVAALVTATDREPDVVVGKPQPGLFTTAATRLGAERPLMIGDRLDTDIAGAAAAGMHGLLVLTGVARPLDLLGGRPLERPAYVGRDVTAVETSHPAVSVDGVAARCGEVVVTAAGDVNGDPASGDGLDGLRAACVLAWNGVLPEQAYGQVIRRLNLS